VRESTAFAGYLFLGPDEYREYSQARLVDEHGADVLPELIHARVTQIKGRDGMLIEGIQQRAKGRKSVHNDRQAWWCQSPPQVAPLADREARERAQLEAALRHQAIIKSMTM
jgi:hypothetical protein